MSMKTQEEVYNKCFSSQSASRAVILASREPRDLAARTQSGFTLIIQLYGVAGLEMCN